MHSMFVKEKYLLMQAQSAEDIRRAGGGGVPQRRHDSRAPGHLGRLLLLHLEGHTMDWQGRASTAIYIYILT